MPKQYKGFNTDKNGLIITYPVVGWARAIFAGMGAVLRLEYVKSEDQFGKKPDSIQLALTSDQAEELAKVLLDSAEKCREQPSPNHSKH